MRSDIGDAPSNICNAAELLQKRQFEMRPSTDDLHYFCSMLTEKEKKFMLYWEQEREKQSSTKAKLINGLPMAVLFSMPVLLLITAVYLFFPEWYTKISNRLAGSLVTIIIALILCTLFYSYFRMHYKWEMNEQLYLELKAKSKKSEDLIIVS